MERIKYIIQNLKDYKLITLLLIIATILYAAINLLSSLVLSFIIDNVINNETIAFSMHKYLARTLGGVEYIKTHLYVVAILLIVIYLIVALLMAYRQRIQGIVSENLVKNIRNDLHKHLLDLPYEFHTKVKTGELLQKCTSDVDVIRRFFSGQFAEIFYIIATAIIALFILFKMNFKLALFASISLPIIFLYSYLFFRKIQKQFLVSDEAEARMSTIIEESLSGIRVVKAFNRELYEIKKLEKVNQKYYDVTYKMILSLGAYWSSSYMICLLGILSVIVMGIFFVRNGSITIGNFIVFISYQTMILYPIRNLGRILSDFGKVTVSIDRIMHIINLEVEDLDSGIKPLLNGDIEFRNVYFRYDNQDVLKNINLTIKAHQTVAIIGSTGSGKSSLVHLLSRLYDVNEGVIFINNHDIKTINKDYLRDNVAIVLQEPFLFSKSIMDNLKIVKDNISDEEVFEACKIASIHDVIKSFENGYDTLVGEKGVTLSGGQKQRLAIARTILKNNKILIFDDSLSAVDTKTDLLIRNNIKKLDKDITTIIVTGRVNSAKDADLIYVLEDGCISDYGKHEDLIKKDGLYKRIYEIQNEDGGCLNGS